MAIINKAKLDAANHNYRALFFKALESNPSQLYDLAIQFMMEMESSGQVETYNWLGDVPSVSEWIGDRVLGDLRDSDMSIRNKEWSTGVKMLYADIEDDKLGQIVPRIQGMAEAFKRFVHTNLVSLIVAGNSTACYDGQNFFSASHSEGLSGTQSNYDAANSLSSTNFRTARAQMIELKNDRGELLGINPTHLWCASALEGTAREICLAEYSSAGAQNMDKGLCQPIVIPGITSTKWGLADLSKILKPFIKQNRRPVSFTSMDKADDANFFMRREVYYGADWRGNFGYGFWQTMYMGHA